jgi:hypothetical protein
VLACIPSTLARRVIRCVALHVNTAHILAMQLMWFFGH